MTNILIGCFLILWIIGMAVYCLHLISKSDKWATGLETGGYKFVVAQDSLIKTLDNVRDHYIDPETGELTPGDKEEALDRNELLAYLEDTWGIYWVSFFWPFRKLHEFEIKADKVSSENGGTLAQRMVMETRKTTYLRAHFPHPIFIPNIELGKDRWQIDLIVVIDFLVFKPAIVVFDYKGTAEVLKLIDASIKSEIIDFCGQEDMSYSEFLKIDKGRASDFDLAISGLNNDKIKKKVIRPGVTRYGMKIDSVRIDGFEISEGQQEQETAIKSIQMKEYEAQAKVKESEGDRDRERLLGEGLALNLTQQLNALIAAGVDPRDAAQIINTRIRTDNIAKAGLSTYIEGGGNVIPSISTDGRKEGK